MSEHDKNNTAAEEPGFGPSVAPPMPAPMPADSGETRLCPLLMMGAAMRPPQPMYMAANTPYGATCLGEKCMWYVSETGPNGHKYYDCAVAHAACRTH